MKVLFRPITLLLLAALSTLGMAQDGAVRQDARAMAVLKDMSDYKGSLNTLVIQGASSSDARLENGLIVSNTEEVRVSLKQPGSMRFRSFDGTNTHELYVHKGQLTLYNSNSGFYAQAKTPGDIDSALDYALAEFAIDLPLMDLIKRNTLGHLVGPYDTVLYLTDKSRARGVDCHQIVIRLPSVDVQVWIQEGEQPLPRRIIITSKWEGGAPRFVANIDWEVAPDFSDSMFKFDPPEGSSRIEFIDAPGN
jgi:hypothetical protein